MHLVLGTTARAMAEQEALRRERTPGPRRPAPRHTHLLSPAGRGGTEGFRTLDRALSLGVLAPPNRKGRQRQGFRRRFADPEGETCEPSRTK